MKRALAIVIAGLIAASTATVTTSESWAATTAHHKVVKLVCKKDHRAALVKVHGKKVWKCVVVKKKVVKKTHSSY